MAIIQKITAPITELPPFSSFTVLGDPGCDGLGAEILSLYARALQCAAGGFILVAGDLVPEGEKPFYEQTNALIESVSQKPVYLLRGNHDTGAYTDYYGLENYALHDKNTLFIVLDNSLGRFTDDALTLLSRAVQEVPRQSVLISMHIPPPNSITKKAVRTEEWARVQQIIDDSPCRGKVQYLIAGHVHSYFEDALSSAKTIVTGGSGARIAPMEGVCTPYNHFVEFSLEKGKWSHRKIDLDLIPTPEPADSGLSTRLSNAFTAECVAHVRYLLLAEDAEKRGMENMSQLYRAIAHAELIHARNHCFTAGGVQPPADALQQSIEQERMEIETMYPEARAYAQSLGAGLSVATFDDALRAEKEHLKLLTRAQSALAQDGDAPADTYYTCSSCGATFHGRIKPKRCPVCGAPFDKIETENKKATV